jgi:putative ABC transport system permease protein
MASLRRFFFRLLNACRPRRGDLELDREVASHLQLLEDDFRGRGLPPEEARHAAKRAFGSVAQTMDSQRDARSLVWLDDARRDLQYAVRMLRRTPGFTAVALLTLALGIGANSAIFSVVNAVLLRPLPYASSDRLVHVSLAFNTGFGERTSIPMADFLAWRASNRACAHVAAYADSETVAVSSAGEAEAVVATAATAQFFDALGAKAAVGRLWRDGDDEPGAPPTVVMSHSYWRDRLNSDPVAIGRTLRIDGEPFTIIGVAPPSFAFPSKRGQLWTSLAAIPPTRRGPFFLRGLGLMKPGAAVDLVNADLGIADEEVRQNFPSQHASRYRVELLKDVITGDVRSALLLLLAAVVVVLLVAVVNVANLLLARAAEREREIAVRAALGAGRTRIMRQLVTEGVVLALAGAAAGWILALWATRGLVAFAPATLPRVAEIHMDQRVLTFTLLIAAVSGILFAMSPALHLSTHATAGALQGGPRSSARRSMRRFRNTLVIAEVALALTLTIGAALLVQSLARLERVDVGFSGDRLVTASIVPPQSRYSDGSRVVAFFDDLLDRVKAIPGVVDASVTNSLPPNGLSETDSFVVEDRLPPPDRGAPVGPILSVGDDYFRVLGARILKGRAFTAADNSTSLPVAIVSASLVRQHFSNLDPVGRRIKQVAEWPKPDTLPWLTIVGVVDDVKYSGLAETTGPALYVPLRQLPFRNQNLVVRVSGDAASVVSGVRAALRTIDRDLPLANVETMSERLRSAAGEPRFRTGLMGLFGVTGLLLAAIGIYGVLSCSVAQRTREIGIRAALGATRRELMQMVLRESLTLAAIGGAGGIALSVSAGQFFRTLLYAVSPTDVVTLVGATIVVSGTAVVAALLPARRAAAVDLNTALRSE